MVISNIFRAIIYIMVTTISSIGFSQIPPGYYDAAQGLSGASLKSALHNIIKNHTEYPYTDNGTDVWDMLKETDKDPNNSSNVILFYTGWSVNANQEYNNGNGWSREHVWSKSHGDFGNAEGPGTDAHHIRPSDISVNAAKSNRWFDEATQAYVDNGQNTGCYQGASDWTWEPRASVKGDVARMIFYMAVRYEGTNGEPDLELIDYFPSDNNTSAPVYAKLTTLYQWHLDDPVDDFERNRNDVIYYNYQNNRNPFIDNPLYANYIWGGETAPLDVLDKKSELNVFPNPSKGILNINSTSQYSFTVSSVLGVELKREENYSEKTIDLTDLSAGIYIININDGNTLLSERIVLE